MSQKPPESAPHPWPHPQAVAGLKRSGPTAFDLRASAAECETIARFLDIADLSHLRLRGTIAADGDEDWRLDARLTANLAQTCVVTLEPVPARIDERVVRRFVPDSGPAAIDLDPEDDDDEIDTFTDTIDPGAVAIEILALALDPYPRAEGVDPVEMRATPPGAAELDEAALKPFSGLAALKARLEGK